MSMNDLTAEAVEKSLIGALVWDRDAIASVAERVTVEAFSVPKWRAIYAAVERCWQKRVPPDIVTVHAELANDPLYAGDDWPAGALDITEAIQHVNHHGWFTHAPYYADAVVGYARKRAMSDAGAKIVQMAHAGGDLDPGMAMHEVLAGLDRFGATVEHAGPLTYDEIVPDFQDRAMRMRSGEIPNRVTATGFRGLDRKLTGGFYPGELIILAARPSMGKTAYALQVAHNVAKRGEAVLLFSAEMSKESLLKRAVSEFNGQPADRTELEMTTEQFDLYLSTLERLRSLPVSIDDTPGITTAQMQVRIQAAQRRRPVGLVIFDYIELAGDDVKGDSEERRINGIVKALKRIARVCDVAVMALCQLNRNVEGRSNKRPTLADLRYSGSLEQDADKVLFLYRHDYYVQMQSAPPEPGTEGTAEVNVGKHRNGPVGVISLHFRPETMKFHDIDLMPNRSEAA